jgi:hypothetical protein
MTSTHSDQESAQPTPPPSRGLDPVHPAESRRQPEPTRATEAAAAEPAPLDATPRAADFGVPAILEHRVVAVEAGGPASPVAVNTWHEDRVETSLLHPVEAQVWARAGRLTLTCPSGREHAFTVLAPEEGRDLRLGEHWPSHQPESRARRLATAAAHDLGDLLTFPAWLGRTAHISGERNKARDALVHRIVAASPKTVVCFGQTFGYLHPKPELDRPYDHRGLVGHEGYPREM